MGYMRLNPDEPVLPLPNFYLEEQEMGSYEMHTMH